MRKESPVELETGSSAANDMVHRTGCGKVKHLETRQLWLQGHVAERAIDVQKIPLEINCADSLTHHWTVKDGTRHLEKVGLVWKE